MGHIQAIETSYAGCRFRSRLEARWAVYLDKCGIKWEHEPEGFKLESGEWYLPDFYLPGEDAWLEVKSDHLWPSFPKFYCAGGIGAEDWRSEFGATLWAPSTEEYAEAQAQSVLIRPGVWAKYVGPFVCGENHEALVDHGTVVLGGGSNWSPMHWDHREEYRLVVFEKCLHSLNIADVLFVYVDKPDCYGTLVEAGWWSQRFPERTAHLAFSPSMEKKADDFWFAAAMLNGLPSSGPVVTARPAEWVRDTLLSLSDVDMSVRKACEFLDNKNVKGTLLWGQPRRDGTIGQWSRGFEVPQNMLAAQAARSARF